MESSRPVSHWAGRLLKPIAGIAYRQDKEDFTKIFSQTANFPNFSNTVYFNYYK